LVVDIFLNSINYSRYWDDHFRFYINLYLVEDSPRGLGKPGWWSLLLMVPIANIVIIAIMAWGKDAPAPAQV